MIDLDFPERIAAARSTFADIRAVVDIERLEADIDTLNEQAGACPVSFCVFTSM